jgi:hypothetical protein
MRTRGFVHAADRLLALPTERASGGDVRGVSSAQQLSEIVILNAPIRALNVQ